MVLRVVDTNETPQNAEGFRVFSFYAAECNSGDASLGIRSRSSKKRHTYSRSSHGYGIVMAKALKRKKRTSDPHPPGGSDPNAGIDYGLAGLGELLRAYRLRVPKYQRDYAWDDQHVGELLDDLAGAIQKGEPRHFLGSVVMTRVGPEELEIVDGQQRLATSYMILCAIRDHFLLENDPTRAQAVTERYICTSDLKSKRTLSRLVLNATDDPFFQEHVTDRSTTKTGPIKASKPSHDRIAEAFRLISDRVAKIAEVAGSASDDALIKWVEYVAHGAAVIRVIVPDHATAFTIFETLNDRGIPLAISDLRKNFLFAAADDAIDNAQAYWLKMSGVLEAMSEKDGPASFLRHFWSSYHGLTRAKEIFKAAKSSVKNKPRHQ
jgi:hypothetical protein